MICASVYLIVFIRTLLVHPAEKILLIQPLRFGGDYPLTLSYPFKVLGSASAHCAISRVYFTRVTCS